jgi:chromosome segregation ATPase
MIDDEQYSSFKFDGDDEPDSEQTLYQEEVTNRRVEKLSHRVTIISILIPVLIGVVFYIAYREITDRVSRSQDTEAMEIQNLSTQLEENFAALSTKYGDLEAALTQKLAALEKVDKAMKTNLKKAEDTVAKINATKANKKDQQDAIDRLNTALNPIRNELKTLAPLRNDLKAVTTELASLDKDLQQQLSTLSKNVDKALKNLTKIQSDMSVLSDRKLDRDSLQLELLKAKKSYQRDLDLTKSAIDKRLASMLRGSGGIVEQEIKE